MKRPLVLLLAFTFHLSPFTASADAPRPHTHTRPCPACGGKRALSLTPPNLGQHDGEIDVTPGKPFKTHRFDVKHPQCPLCGGAGRREMWTAEVQPPPEGAAAAICLNCRGTGVAPCRKCKKTGLVPCVKCRGQKAPGWIRTEEKTAGRTSRHRKTVVEPCPVCKGIGQTDCPACDGRGGEPCRPCNGSGYRAARGRAQ